jgi:ABC-type transport system involved in multi-copper enzyme maturation permease subunit
MIGQTIAMLVDSLRHLRSRYLFWVVLIVSCLAAISLFATYSFNAEGINLLGMTTFENASLTKGSSGSRSFVAGVFNAIFVKLWLGWGAIILALISTASVLPDFLQSGAIDVVVSKPISRLRLLLLKFLGSLAFVVIQVGVGVGLAHLIIGFKFDLWLHTAFWAVPLITLQFVYLYAFSAFLAVATRSTMASLLGTLLFWFVIFIVQFSANTLTEEAASSRFMMESQEARVTAMEAHIAGLDREPNSLELRQLDVVKARAAEHRKLVEGLEAWEKWLTLVETAIPKTGDVQRILANALNAPVGTEFVGLFADLSEDEFRPADMDEEEMREAIDAGIAGERAKRRVDAAISIGTSLGFTAIVIIAAGWVFKRRDL